MPRYVVLLRGVNVGKGQRVPMAAFRSVLEGLGHTDVTTLLNSGNAVFTSGARSGARLSSAMAEAMAGSFGVSVLAVVKSAADLAQVVAGNPLDVPASDHSRFLVAFAQDADTLGGLAPLQALAQPPERFAIGPQAAYLHCANGILDSRLGAAILGKAGRSVTTRNWATVLRISDLLGATGPGVDPVVHRLPRPPRP